MSSIKEVAKAAGVSVTTVSYVLNGKGNISPETRQRVLQVIQDLGYMPSIQARNLRDQQSRTIGYAWRAPLDLREGNPVLDTFLHQVIRMVEAQGLHVLVFNDPRQTNLDVFRDLIRSKRVDGFVLANTEANDERIEYLYEYPFPFVAFGRSASNIDQETCWVDVDGKIGIYTATEHLIQQGHQRIALLGWPVRSVAGDERAAGYLEALDKYGIMADPDLFVRSENLFTSGYKYAHELMSLPEPPTAVVALSDIIAIGALRYFTEHGLHVAVTGFDDVPAAEYVSPPLTSVRQPIHQVARILVEMLLLQLQGLTVEQKQHLLAPELIIRASSLRI